MYVHYVYVYIYFDLVHRETILVMMSSYKFGRKNLWGRPKVGQIIFENEFER